ncbi:hypothetical protein ACFL54_08930, partial [Planctomycetota bacterium]
MKLDNRDIEQKLRQFENRVLPAGHINRMLHDIEKAVETSSHRPNVMVIWFVTSAACLLLGLGWFWLAG